MNNFEIISRVLSQDNADINKVKTETNKLKTETNKLKTKEDGFIKLNTDALAGQRFGSETPINLDQNIVLDLFNVNSTEELYSQIRGFDNKTFVLKPNGNSFTVDGIQYTITACNPCIGKIYDYNSIPILCLTFLIDTFNSQTALFKFFISANSNTEISGKLTVENIVSKTDIKTINGESIVGSGDITLQDKLVSGTNIKTINGESVIGSGDITLQDKLVSGTNIKTINGESVIGSGDIIISGYPVVIHGKNDTTFTLTPNTFHIWGEVPSLTLKFGSNINGVTNEYLFQFTSGTTVTSLALPNSIKWANNSVPTIKPNMVYQISILRGLASVLEFSSDMYMYFDPNNYLTIEALEDNLTASFTNDIEYTIDGEEWIKLNAGNETPPINIGQTLSFRGKITPKQYHGIGTFTISKKCNLKGNCMSMLFGDNAADNISLSSKDYAFYRLFLNCTNIVNIDSNFLPATALANNCYTSMFDGCSNLVSAPELPATTLADSCYYSMFDGCIKLTTAPELPATTLAEDCYYYMFYNCTSLTTAPALPATTLASDCYYGMFVGTDILPDCSNIDFTSSTVVASGGLSGLFYGTKVTDNDLERLLPKNNNGRYYLPVTTLADSCYHSMFKGCKNLTTAPKLPAIALSSNCYSSMFNGCTSLTTAPELPATTLVDSCYQYMFDGCTSLVNAPELPATTLATYCYNHMFYGCTSLVNAPELPATILARGCYQNMFYGCTSLTTAPSLPATTLADSCYRNMFENCSNLTTAPELPATTLADECYRNMFYGCKSLTTAPSLPATTLADYCYDWMFSSCTGLITAPELPATTLASNCYNWMFGNCTSLTIAPELPATTLASNCYSSMFYNCSNLNYIKMLATDISASNCLNDWVNGVSSTGTFVKNAAMESLPTGSSGIPSGWTVQNAQ